MTGSTGIVGDVVCFDFETEANTVDVGTTTSIFSRVKTPSAADITGLGIRVFGVLQTAAPVDGDHVTVRLYGITNVNVVTGLNLDYMTTLSPAVGEELIAGGTGLRILAGSLEDVTTSGVTMVECLFDGVSGAFPSVAG
jgi:hypothetical protein